MGLGPGDENRLFRHVLIACFPVIFLLLAALAFLAFDDMGRAGFAYERSAIQAGEFHRLITGHLVHLGMGHLLLNCAGLLLVWFLVGASLSTTQWGIVTFVSTAAIDAGFYWLMPGLAWYVGLSGLLHGLLVAGIAASWRRQRIEIRLLGGLLIVKLAWEAFMGPVPGSGSLAGGEVVTEALLFGAIGGLLATAVIWIRVRAKASI